MQEEQLTVHFLYAIIRKIACTDRCFVQDPTLSFDEVRNFISLGLNVFLQTDLLKTEEFFHVPKYTHHDFFGRLSTCTLLNWDPSLSERITGAFIAIRDIPFTFPVKNI